MGNETLGIRLLKKKIVHHKQTSIKMQNKTCLIKQTAIKKKRMFGKEEKGEKGKKNVMPTPR